MSDESVSMDLREQLARIDRAQEETRKFSEETRKFSAEAIKLQNEAFKLHNEGLKLGRDRFLSPILAVIGIIGGIVTIANLLLQHVKP